MAHIIEDRVLETTTTTGTGALTLAGAQTGFRSFSSVMSVGDTCWYGLWAVDSSGNTTGVYEEGLGTFGASNTLTRTTVIRSSNSNSVVTLATGTCWVAIVTLATKTLIQDNLGGIALPGSTTDPVTPTTGNLSYIARLFANRPVPSWKASLGRIDAAQPAFFSNCISMYLPNNGTTIGLNLGIPWVAGGTVSHPTPATTAPAVVNQIRRTRFANVATTTNQVLGVSAMASGVQQFWRGNATGLGGFFFYSRFIVELWPASTVRLFVGLSDQTTAVVASDTYAGNLCGLSHITTDAATVLNFTTRDGTTVNKTAITLTQALQAGQAFDFYMYAAPNDSTIYYRLDDINAGTTLIDSSTTTNLPSNTVFMGPQIHMSNGTANTTVTTTALGIAKVYIESDY